MKVAVFSTKRYDREALERFNAQHKHELEFFEAPLRPRTAQLAQGYEGVIVFVNDIANSGVIEQLARGGTRIITSRSAGINHVDLHAAADHGISVARVPMYSPSAISEFTVGLILTLGRQIHRAYIRVRENNFELQGLQGFEIRDQTIGVFGTGRIGAATIKNLSGFGPRILAYDVHRNPDVEDLVTYVDDPLDVFRRSTVLTFHMPLTPSTHHIVNADSIRLMQDGVFIVNTSRGALMDTAAVVQGLKSRKIGYLAIDVYEEEGDLFFQDLSDQVVQDDVFARLLTFPNVLVTGHQAFLTDRALGNIAETTLANLSQFERTGTCDNVVKLEEFIG